MKKDWTTTKLIAAGSLGVLALVLELLGSGISAVTGIPMLGGFINAIVVSAVMMICLFVVDQLGTVTLMSTVRSVLTLPFHIAGTPGFLPKVPIAIIAGVIVDLLYLPLKRNKRIASLVAGGLSRLYTGAAVVEVGRLFGIPGVEQTAELFYSPAGITAALVLGAIGGYLGYLTYQKIKSTAVVKRIQGG